MMWNGNAAALLRQCHGIAANDFGTVTASLRFITVYYEQVRGYYDYTTASLRCTMTPVRCSYDLCDAMKIEIRYCRYNSLHNSVSFSIFIMYNNLDYMQVAALEEENLLAAAALVIRDRGQCRRQRQRQREVWVKPWLLRRPVFRQYENLLVKLNREDPRGDKNFLRVTPELFNKLVDHVGPHLQKQDTFWRKSLEPGLRIAISLHYMATGDSYKSLQYVFRVRVRVSLQENPLDCEHLKIAKVRMMTDCVVGVKTLKRSYKVNDNSHYRP